MYALCQTIDNYCIVGFSKNTGNKKNKKIFFVQSVTYATLLNFKDKHKQELSLFVRSIPPFQAFTGKKDMAHLQQ